MVAEISIYVNGRITYGPPRNVEWKDEVVVITGGGAGLGRILREMLMLGKGVKVAVLDVRGADEESKELMEERGGLMWEVCDVGDLEAVKRVAEKIKEELGNPTILINNAATPVNGLPLLPSSNQTQTLTSTHASHTLKINTTSHFNTLTTFLPILTTTPNGAHIITISSILAHLSPSNLSDYAASKAALSSLHQTLTHELSTHPSPHIRRNIKTILVEPGQMNTQLFADITSVPWYANFFGPVLDAKDVATEIVGMIGRGEGGVIRTPAYCKFMPLYGVLPGMFQRGMRWFAGIDRAISVDGRGGGKKEKEGIVPK